MRRAIRLAVDWLTRCCDAVGLSVTVRRKPPKDTPYPHAVVVPGATFSPWECDRTFQKVYQRIREYTMVDRYRCYELWQLVAQSAKLSGALLEVGAWRGGTGALISSRARECGIEDPIYICDTFTGLKKVGIHDPAYVNDLYNDTSVELVQDLYRRLGLRNTHLLPGIFPEETGNQVPEPRFRFCHIDVDVYEGGRGALEWIWGKLVIGGLVVFDDYGFPAPSGITRLVEEQRSAPGRIVVHNLNGHAVLVKTSS